MSKKNSVGSAEDALGRLVADIYDIKSYLTATEEILKRHEEEDKELLSLLRAVKVRLGIKDD